MISTVVAIVLFAIGIGLIISANMITYRIIEEVNARLGSEQQFSIIFVQRRWPEILDQYRQFSPNSKLPRRVNIFGAVGVIFLVVAFVVLFASGITLKTKAR